MIDAIRSIIGSVSSVIYMLTVSAGLYVGATQALKLVHDTIRDEALKKAASDLVDMEAMSVKLTGVKPDY